MEPVMKLSKKDDVSARRRFMDYVRVVNMEKARTSKNWVTDETHFRASQLAIPCVRQYRLKLKYNVPLKDEDLSNMIVGDFVHHRIQDMFPELMHEQDVEYYLEDENGIEFMVTGHSDMIDVRENERRLWEIKSTRYINSFNKAPTSYHIRQAMLYADYHQLENVRILYVQKADYEMFEWNMKFKQTWADSMIDDARYLRKCIVNENWPDKTVGNWCKWCKHKKQCREIEKDGNVVEEVEV